MELKLSNVKLENIWFSSDPHFHHTLVMTQRGFNSTEEMDEELIKRWNSVVETHSHIFFLGDLSWTTPEKTAEILERLNGIKYLVRGNHDWQLEKKVCAKHFKVIADRIELIVPDEDTFMNNKDPKAKKVQLLVLDHYPILSWLKKFHGSVHCFGHVHSRLLGKEIGLSMDVGVDANNLTPVSYAEVKNFLKIKINHEKTDS